MQALATETEREREIAKGRGGGWGGARTKREKNVSGIKEETGNDIGVVPWFESGSLTHYFQGPWHAGTERKIENRWRRKWTSRNKQNKNNENQKKMERKVACYERSCREQFIHQSIRSEQEESLLSKMYRVIPVKMSGFISQKWPVRCTLSRLFTISIVTVC